MTTLTKKLAQRIKELRLERGLTQEEAARKCHMEYKYYQRYEGSDPRDMRLSTMEKLANGFDIPLWKLLKFD
ncbi:MAG: helix-turn-helix transcriptional regulator [Candidatus Babeliales bacterium]